MFIYNCVAFDVVFLRTPGALRFALVRYSTIAARVQYCFRSLFTLEFFLPMECK